MEKRISQCIYCKQFTIFFNKEHVIPESLGLFGTQTRTLINIVCKSCNDLFAKTIEKPATRDSILLSHRLSHELMEDKYKSLRYNRNYSAIVTQLSNNEMVDVLLQRINGTEYAVRPDHMTVYNSTRGRKYATPSLEEKSCHRSLLEAHGLYPRVGYIEPYFNLFAQLNKNKNLSEVQLIQKNIIFFNALMKRCDINLSFSSNKDKVIINNEGESQKEIHILSSISHLHLRLLAKIAFNYFLHFKIYFNEIKSFDSIIQYIMLGGNYHHIIRGDPRGSIIEPIDGVKPTNCHVLFMVKNNNRLFVVISLFNDGVFFVKLAEKIHLEPEKVADIFLITEQRIIRIDLSLSFLTYVNYLISSVYPN